jgi:hypothetical protein
MKWLGPAFLTAASLGVWAVLIPCAAQTPLARPSKMGARERGGASLRFMGKLLLGMIGLVPIIPSEAHSQTPTAVIIPNGYTQFSDANGKPLAAGTVFLYTPGTTTAKTSWQDPYQSVANPNPIVLNGSGEALIWGSGIYRQVVYDVNNNLIWDQLTGGYNCVGGGAVPLGANGAIQYNNNGIFGGLPLGTTGQVLLANPSGAATWGAPPAGSVSTLTGLGAGVAAALALPLDGTGPLVAENNPTINNPTINGGTWNNPTFTGTITGLPGGGSATCTNRTGGTLAHCIGSSAIFNEEVGIDPLPGGTGHSINAFMTGQIAAWDVYLAAGLKATSTPQEVQAAVLDVETQVSTAHRNVANIPAIEAEIVILENQIKQVADAAHIKLK